jgi:hypothetical protein
MKKFWPLLFIAMGVCLLLGGFIFDVLFAGIPYQDPTPDMSARYTRQSRIASVIGWSGVGALVFGIACLVFRRLRRPAVLCLPVVLATGLQSCTFGPCGTVFFWNWKDKPLPGVTYSGGDGSSIEQAVVIQGTHSVRDTKRAEEVWTWNHNLFYDQNIAPPMRTNENRGAKRYDAFTIHTKAHKAKTKTIYFDVTSVPHE